MRIVALAFRRPEKDDGHENGQRQTDPKTIGDAFYRCIDEIRLDIIRLDRHALGKYLLQIGHFRVHGPGHIDQVGVGLFDDGDKHRLFSIGIDPGIFNGLFDRPPPQYL